MAATIYNACDPSRSIGRRGGWEAARGRRSSVSSHVVAVKDRVVGDQTGKRGVRGDNEQARARLRDETWASITKPSNRYQPLESAAPIAAKSRPTCEVSALQTFSRTIIRVARLSTLNAFISSKKGQNVLERSPFEPDAGTGKGPGKGTTPSDIGVARQIGGRHLGNVTSSKVFATRIRRVVGRLLRVEIVWQTGTTRRGRAPRGSFRFARRIRETQTWPAPDEPRRCAGRGRASRRRTPDCTSRAGSSYRSNPSGSPGRRRDMYEIRSRFLCRPSRRVSFSKCSSDRFSSRVRRDGTCGGKQTKSVRVVGGKRRLVSPPPRARRRANRIADTATNSELGASSFSWIRWELVGSDLRRTQHIRRFLEISCQLTDLMKIRSLRVWREVS